MKRLINISEYLPNKNQSQLNSFAIKSVEKLFKINRINQFYATLPRPNENQSFCYMILKQLNIQLEVTNLNPAQTKFEGPIIFVSNHPFGALDGIIMSSILEKIRPDFKIFANRFLGQIDEIKDNFILVDAFSTNSKENIKPLKESIKWLKQNHALGIFPAGEVSHFQTTKSAITDPEWNTHVAKLAKKSGATIVPLYFEGKNSLMFQLLGLIHPRLRTAMLPRELLNKSDKKIQITIGTQIPQKVISKFENAQKLTAYLRLQSYTLSIRGAQIKRRDQNKINERIINPINTDYLASEIENLIIKGKLILQENSKQVFCCTAEMIPWILTEIGRLREETFRLVQEGTGKCVDLDEYDYFYHHLFIWDEKDKEIVGAYRIGLSDEILKTKGLIGLYTSTLFRYKKKFIKNMSPAIELGRSFIQKKYQKQYSSLLLLWKGICAFISKNPSYRYLFGPVSISNAYDPISKDMMIQFLKKPQRTKIKARTPIKSFSNKEYSEFIKTERFNTITDISMLIAGFENDHKEIPILIKQYLKMGGQIVSFNIDPDFNDALDGLIVLDMYQIPEKLLNYYMGNEAAEIYRRSHNLKSAG